ncbi:MAG: DUF302 domain-containing protein [Thioalkalivibrionaceae bacterium]
MGSRLGALIVSLVIAAAFAPAVAQAQTMVLDTDDRRIYSIEGEWSLYRELVEDAITQQGMVINTVGHIASMLERTGAAVGGEPIYRHGEALEFCSAVYSRRMMEADPHAIVFCPYVIAVYELQSEPGTVYIGYQKTPVVGDEATQSALNEVNALIERVVQGAIAF